MFSIGDQIVHPMHGAGEVIDIVSRELDGIQQQYYVLQIAVGNMTAMVPVKTSVDIGVRPIMSKESAEEVLKNIPMINCKMNPNWNQRYRENMELIKSGNLNDVAAVIKGLTMRDNIKGLSTGERRMLHSAKQILVSEMVLSLGESYMVVEKRLEEMLGMENTDGIN